MQSNALTPPSPESLAEFQAVQERFAGSFGAFTEVKKLSAAAKALQQEFAGLKMAGSPAFIEQVARRIEDAALEEAPEPSPPGFLPIF